MRVIHPASDLAKVMDRQVRGDAGGLGAECSPPSRRNPMNRQ